MRLRDVALFFFALHLAACSCGGGRTEGQAAKFAPRLALDESGEADYLLDFGVVEVGTRARSTVSIDNEGNTALVLRGERLERPFSHGLPSAGLTIAVGATSEIDFFFEPPEATETPSGALATLRTNEPGSPSYTIRLVGHGREATLECVPSEVDFGPLSRGVLRQQEIRCTNPLPIPLEVRLGELKGHHAKSFAASFVGDVEGPRTVQPEESIQIEVSFRADSLGRNTTILPLEGPTGRALTTIPLSGTTVLSDLAFDPTTCLDFSYVGVGERAQRALTVWAIGGKDIRLLEATIPEEGSGAFSVETSFPLLLPADGSKESLSLSFHPDVSGPFETQLSVRLEDGQGAARVVETCLKGFGGGPTLSCDRELIDFGSIALGMPARETFHCQNDGAPVPGSAIDPLRIQGVQSSAPEFRAEVLNRDGSRGPKVEGYAVGEGFTVEVRYEPTAERVDTAVLEVEAAGAAAMNHEVALFGEARDLPPCDFSIEPPALNFGIVDRGSELRRSFRIKNYLATSCLIRDLQPAEGSDPAFTVESDRNLELEGEETLEVEVVFAPTEYRSVILGAIEFTISNPGRSHQRVDLRGSSSNPCLQIEPRVLDFGVVEPSCSTPQTEVILANICGVPITIDSVALDDTADAGSFRLSAGSYPRTLAPRDWERLSVTFQPARVGSYAGAIFVNVQSSEPYVSILRGRAAVGPTQTDRFVQLESPKVDILWVMDNSGSFEEYQDRVGENLPAFLEGALNRDIDFHIAITTSGLDARRRGDPALECPGGAFGGEDGRLFPVDGSHPRILNRLTPDIEDHWAANMRVGTCHSIEEYFEAAYRALSEPLISEVKSSRHAALSSYNDGNAGFLRKDAALSIIFVADEPEQSVRYGRSVMDYVQFFRSLKGPSARVMFKAHAITGAIRKEHSPCQLGVGDRFHQMVEETEGVLMDICTPRDDASAWAEGLRTMSEGAFGFSARFALRGAPADRDGNGEINEADLELTVDGRPWPPLSGSGQRRWSYDPHNRAIVFQPLFIPNAGSQIAVTYLVACER